MKIIPFTLALLACGSMLQAQSVQNTQQNARNAQQTKERLTSHLYYLASDELRGREAGSADALKAAEYIENQYKAIGLKPFFEDYRHHFQMGGDTYTNIVAQIEGADPGLKDEYIVLGAHYDHLGVKRGKIYNGADDNASGSAALIEVARELYGRRDELKRSVIIAAFDAEELGLFGSMALADVLKDSIGTDRIKLMMSIDMVGWYKASGKLVMEGAATIRDGKRLLDNEAAKMSISVEAKDFEKSAFTGTDTQYFAEKGVPTLAVTTGLKSPYHKPGDDAELIDYDGLERVTEYVAAVGCAAASDPDFAPSGQIARKHLDLLPTFEAGLVLSIQRSNLNFEKSSLTTKNALGVGIGPQFQVNFNSLALNAKVLYDFAQSRFPVDSDLWGSRSKYRQQAVTVPVMLISNSVPKYSLRAFAGIGGYYSYVFWHNAAGKTLSSRAVDVNRHQCGIAYCIGMQAGPILLCLEGRSQLNSFFAGADFPEAALETVSLTLGYDF